eukprot:Colp12_sorted_trinity150504_noHs@26315
MYGMAFELKNVQWHQDHPFRAAAPATQFRIGGEASFFTLLAFSWLGVFLFVTSFLGARSVNRWRSLDQPIGHRLWPVVWGVCWAASTILFIPFASTLLQTFTCEAGFLTNTTLTCWGGPHVILAIISGLLLAIYLPFVVRLAAVGGNLARTAYYFWFKWNFDQPETLRVHLSSLRCVVHERASVVLCLAMVLITTFINNGPLASSLLLATSLATVCVAYRWPPFYVNGANGLLGACLFMVLWVDIGAVVASAHPLSLPLLIAHFVVLLPAAILGAYVMYSRSRRVAASDVAKRMSPL